MVGNCASPPWIICRTLISTLSNEVLGYTALPPSGIREIWVIALGDEVVGNSASPPSRSMLDKRWFTTVLHHCEYLVGLRILL